MTTYPGTHGSESVAIFPSAGGRAFESRAHARAARGDWINVAMVGSVALAVALFLSDGGIYRFTSFAESMTSMGILTGLIGTNLICLMLLLAARIPVVDRTMGHDRALALHSSLGKPVLYLLLAHGIFLTIGYAATDGSNVVTETVTLIGTVADMPLAYIGLALFVLVAISSVVAVRRHFPYEVWQVIHLLTYAGTAASIPHQFSTGGLFLPGTAQRWYWLALYTLTASSLLVFRFLVPLITSLQHRVRVHSVRHEGPGIFSVTMTGNNLQSLNAQAGQFFTWRFLARGQWWHAHPLSLSAAPDGTSLRVTIKATGKGTARLGALRPGTAVYFEGPYGMFTENARTAEGVMLIGSGSGMAPIRALLEGLTFASGKATVVLRASRETGILHQSEIERLCAERGARLFYAAGARHPFVDSWLPGDWVDQGTTLGSFGVDPARTDLYVCGPGAWTDLVTQDAEIQGFKASAIHHERFSL